MLLERGPLGMWRRALELVCDRSEARGDLVLPSVDHGRVEPGPGPGPGAVAVPVARGAPAKPHLDHYEKTEDTCRKKETSITRGIKCARCWLVVERCLCAKVTPLRTVTRPWRFLIYMSREDYLNGGNR